MYYKKKYNSVLLYLLTLLIGLSLCSCKKDEQSRADSIYQYAQAGMTVEELDPDQEAADTVTLEVEIPDYEQLLREALQNSNPEKYLEKALKEKNYTVLRLHVEADVSTENGRRVVHRKEAVEKLLDDELNRALKILFQEELQ